MPALEKVGYLFRDCKSLSHLFCGCEQLREANLSGVDLHSVTSLTSAFEGCTSLTELDLSGLKGARTQEMDYCFKGCASLTELDLSSLTVNIESMYGDTYCWFQGCSSLKSLKLPDVIMIKSISGWYRHHLRNLFEGCDALERWSAPASWPVDDLDAIPKPTASCGMWWSQRDQAWMTVKQIRAHGPVADTYTSEPPAGT